MRFSWLSILWFPDGRTFLSCATLAGHPLERTGLPGTHLVNLAKLFQRIDSSALARHARTANLACRGASAVGAGEGGVRQPPRASPRSGTALASTSTRMPCP